MKHQLFCLVFALFFISCNNIKPDLKVNVNDIRSIDTISPDSIICKVYKINLSVINNSKFDVIFWAMSCSWTDNWIINNDKYVFGVFPCDGNSPKKIQIKAKDSILYKAVIIPTENTRYQNVKDTRFGFILIDTTNCKSSSEYFQIIGDRSKQNNIIWSNPLPF